MRTALAKCVELDTAPFAKLDAQPAVVRPAHEEHDVVHAEVRRNLTGIARQMSMFSGPDVLLHDLQNLHAHLPGNLEIRARRRSVTKHEFSGVDLRKQLGAKPHATEPENQAAADQIGRHDEIAMADHDRDGFFEARLQSLEPILLFLMFAPSCSSCGFNSHTHTIGTSVLDSKYDEIIAKPTAKASGMNND